MDRPSSPDELSPGGERDSRSAPAGAPASAGRNEEFVRLFVRHEPRIYAYIRSLVVDPNDAEEVLQQTATVLWSKFHEFQPGTNFPGWAFKVAYWEARSLAKRKRRDTLVFSETFIDAVAREHEQRWRELDQVQQALAYCLERLRPRDRELYHLRYVMGQTLAQMATHAGRPLDTIHSALKRVRRLLNECVARRLAAEGRA